MQLTLFDLQPLPPKDKGGRPRWKKTKEKHRLVSRMLKRGHSRGEIAAALEISEVTLKRYFSGAVAWQRRWGHRSRAGRAARAEAEDEGNAQPVER